MIVVILCHNELSVTMRCANHITKSSDNKDGVTVIWVDNNSADKTWPFLQQLEQDYPYMKSVHNDENKWFTHAVDDIVQQYPGEDIMLLNNDFFVEDGWLSGRERLKDYGLLAMTQLFHADKRLVIFAGGQPDFMGHMTMWEWREKELWNGNPHEEYWVTFGGCMINRKAFDDIGGFDRSLKFYCSDSDMSLRMRDKRYKVAVDPAMRGVHLNGYSTHRKMANDGDFARAVNEDSDQKRFSEKHGVSVGGRPLGGVFPVRKGVTYVACDIKDPRPYFNFYFSLPDMYENNLKVSKKIAEDFYKLAELKPGMRIHEIGCAYGNVVKELQDLGIDAYGYDVSDYAIWKGKVKNCSDIITYGQRYDLMYSFAVLEHLEETKLDKLLEDISILTDRTIHDIDTEHGLDQTHVTIHPIEWWYEKFAKCGFTKHKILRQEGSVYMIEFTKGAK